MADEILNSRLGEETTYPPTHVEVTEAELQQCSAAGKNKDTTAELKDSSDNETEKSSHENLGLHDTVKGETHIQQNLDIVTEETINTEKKEQDENERLRKTLESKKKENTNLKLENESLKEDKNTASGTIMDLANKDIENQHKIFQLDADLKDLQDRFDDLEKTKLSVEKQLQQQQNTLKSEKERLTRILQSEKKQHKEEMDKLRKEFDDLEKTKLSVEKQLQQQQNTLKSEKERLTRILQSEKKQHKEEMDKLRTETKDEIKKKNTDIEKKSKEIEKKNKKIDEKDEEIRKTKENLSKVKSEKENADLLIVSYESYKIELHHRIANMQTQKEKDEDKLKQLRNQVTEENNNLKRLTYQYQELTNQAKTYYDLNRSLQKDKKQLETEKQGLLLRLSKLAGANLTYNNPSIADLSDEKRPTKLAEEFSELYDNEWTDAFEEVVIENEEQKTSFMLELLMRANQLCLDLSNGHVKKIKESLSTLTLPTPTTLTEQDEGNIYEDKNAPSDEIKSNVTESVGKDNVPDSERQKMDYDAGREGHTSTENGDEKPTVVTVATQNKHNTPISSKTDFKNNLDEEEESEHKPEDNSRPEENLNTHGSSGAMDKSGIRTTTVDNKMTDDILARNVISDENGRQEQITYSEDSIEGKKGNGVADDNKAEQKPKDGSRPEEKWKTDDSTDTMDKSGIRTTTGENKMTDDTLAGNRISDESGTQEQITYSEDSMEDRKGIYEESDTKDKRPECENSKMRKMENNDKNDDQGISDKNATQGTVQDDEDSMKQQMVNDDIYDDKTVQEQETPVPASDTEHDDTNSTDGISDKNATQGTVQDDEDSMKQQMVNDDDYDDKTVQEQETPVPASDTEYDDTNSTDGISDKHATQGTVQDDEDSMKHQMVNDDDYDDKTVQEQETPVPASDTEHDDTNSTDTGLGQEVVSPDSERDDKDFTDVDKGIETNQEPKPNAGQKQEASVTASSNTEHGGTNCTDTEQEQQASVIASSNAKHSDTDSKDTGGEPNDSKKSGENADTLGAKTGKETDAVETDGKLCDANSTDAGQKQEASVTASSNTEHGGTNCTDGDRGHEKIKEPKRKRKLESDFELLRNEQKKTILEARKFFELTLAPEVEKAGTDIIVKEKGINREKQETVVTYIRKCINICWSMCRHDPPVHVDFPDVTDDIPFDTNKYKPYTKTGKHLSYIVWPALYLYAAGPMLSKGVAQGK